MKLKEGLAEDCIYLPKKLWGTLGWNIDNILDIKIRKIDDRDTLIITVKGHN